MSQATKKTTITSTRNSTEVKSNRRRVQICQLTETSETGEVTFIGKNTIAFKALVADVGAKPGVLHKTSDCERIKTSAVVLTDDALVEVYYALKAHFERHATEASKLIANYRSNEICK